MIFTAGMLGVPYLDGGRVLAEDGGLDCWGFVYTVYLANGVLLPQYGGAFGKARDVLFNAEKQKWDRHKAPRPLDVVLFRLPCDGWHCGVVLDDLVSFAHCCRPSSRINRLDEPVWRITRRGFYSWKRQ